MKQREKRQIEKNGEKESKKKMGRHSTKKKTHILKE